MEPTHVTKGLSTLVHECGLNAHSLLLDAHSSVHTKCAFRVNAHLIRFQFRPGLAQRLTCSRSGSGTSLILAEGGLFSCHVLPSCWSSAEFSKRQRLRAGEVCRGSEHTYSLQAHRVHTYVRTYEHTHCIHWVTPGYTVGYTGVHCGVHCGVHWCTLWGTPRYTVGYTGVHCGLHWGTLWGTPRYTVGYTGVHCGVHRGTLWVTLSRLAFGPCLPSNTLTNCDT